MPTGSCLCRQLKYSFSDSPITCIVCHCQQCRKLCSSAFTVNLLVHTAAVTIHGSTAHYTFTQEIGDVFQTTFCPNCGTTIASQCVEANACDKSMLNCLLVEGGTLDQERGGASPLEGLKIEMEFFVKHRPSWIHPVEGSAQHHVLPGL